MINPFLIAVVGSACQSAAVSSAFLIMGLNDLPSCDLFARWCNRWNRWNLARMFFHCLGQVWAWTQLWTVFRSLTVSCQILSNRAKLVSQNPCWTVLKSAGRTSELLPGTSCLDLRLLLLILLVCIPFLSFFLLSSSLDSHKFLSEWRRNTSSCDPRLGDQCGTFRWIDTFYIIWFKFRTRCSWRFA